MPSGKQAGFSTSPQRPKRDRYLYAYSLRTDSSPDWTTSTNLDAHFTNSTLEIDKENTDPQTITEYEEESGSTQISAVSLTGITHQTVMTHHQTGMT